MIPGPIELLDAVAHAGYAGIDLGPLGYLGSRAGAARAPADARALARRRLLRDRGSAIRRRSCDALVVRLDALLDTFDATDVGPPFPAGDALADARLRRCGAAG